MEVEQRMREGGGKDDRVRHWGLKRDGPKCEFGPMMKGRSEEHTSELQSQSNLVCRLLLEKKKKTLSTFVIGDHLSRLVVRSSTCTTIYLSAELALVIVSKYRLALHRLIALTSYVLAIHIR